MAQRRKEFKNFPQFHDPTQALNQIMHLQNEQGNKINSHLDIE